MGAEWNARAGSLIRTAAMSLDPLLQHLDAFVGFARARTGDPELAADLVQECLLKAMKADQVPEDAEGVVTWFYRVLRNAIIDAHRRRRTREESSEALAFERFLGLQHDLILRLPEVVVLRRGEVPKEPRIRIDRSPA